MAYSSVIRLPVARLDVKDNPLRFNRPDMNKHRNVPVTIDGIRFASKQEGARYLELKVLFRAAKIQDLKIHPRFILRIGQYKICAYVADFSYWRDGGLVVEDVKGRKSGGPYQMFRLKKKLMLAILGIDVLEV